MKRTEITIPVRLDMDTYRRYCHFHSMVLNKQWLAPAVAGVVMLGLGIAALVSGRPELKTPAGILIGLGVAIPVLYFVFYFIRVYSQASRLRLRYSPAVYTLRLTEEAVRVENNQQKEDAIAIPWDQMYAAYRVRDCIYLYPNKARAFLLPAGQADAPQNEVWYFLVNQMGKDNCFNRQIT